MTHAREGRLNPMKQSWLFCVIWLCVVAVVPLTVCAQSGSGSVVLRGSISKTVALSCANTSCARAAMNAFDSGAILTLLVSGSGVERDLQVPILFRSNTPYKIIASVESQTAVPTQLRVLDIAASGKLVAADADTSPIIGPFRELKFRLFDRFGFVANRPRICSAFVGPASCGADTRCSPGASFRSSPSRQRGRETSFDSSTPAAVCR